MLPQLSVELSWEFLKALLNQIRNLNEIGLAHLNSRDALASSTSFHEARLRKSIRMTKHCLLSLVRPLVLGPSTRRQPQSGKLSYASLDLTVSSIFAQCSSRILVEFLPV